jgi:malate permease and related proteins
MLVTLFLKVCLPIFVVVGLGWVLDKKFALSLETLVKLNLYLMVPAFIFVRVTDAEVVGERAAWVALCTLGTMLGCGLLSACLAWMLRLGAAARSAHVLACMLANCGNFGFPLITLAFGKEAAAVQVYVLVTMNVCTFTLGVLLANVTGRAGWHAAVRSTLRQPAVYAVGAALALKAVGWDVRELPWLWQPGEMLADALVGFALVTLGVQLSQTRPAPLKPPLWSVLVVRLLCGPVIAFAITWVSGFDRSTAAVVILAMGAPTAVNSALLAHEFGGDRSFATGAVYYSTLLSMITVTLWLALLQQWI